MTPRTARLGLFASVLLVAGCATEETPRLTELRITPGSHTLEPGVSVSLAVEAFDALGNPMRRRAAHWSSRAPGVATVGATSGFVTGVSPGNAEIVAVVEGVTGTAQITVAYPLPHVRTVRVEPGIAEIRTSLSRQFTATALDAEGNPIPGRPPQWQSSAPEVASVSPSGVVTAMGPGRAVIIAQIDDRAGYGTVDVVPRAASVEVSGRSQLDQVADTVELTVVVRDGDGAIIPGWPVTWSSSDQAVVRVSSSGKISSWDIGAAVITATSEQSHATLPVTVTRLPVAQVSIQPGIAVLARNRFIGLLAVAMSADGLTLKGRETTWATSNPTVATINADGVVASLAAGTAVITASVIGLSAQLPIEVVENAAPSLSLGIWHSCSVAAGEHVYCWGGVPSAGSGQEICLDVTYYNNPFFCIRFPAPLIGGSQLVSVTAGDWHSCGLTASGAAWCWGANWNSQLGVSSASSTGTPIQVSGDQGFAALAAGGQFSCGLKAGGAAWCWGSNSQGQLGNGSLTPGFSPTLVQGSHSFVQLTAGGEHACGLTAQSRLYCWGDNGLGQLGDGSFVDRTTPVEVATTQTFVAVDGGASHTCGISISGAAYCWGSGNNGNLGDGVLALRAAPTAVSGGHKWLSINAGGGHTCGVRIDGTGWCWGSNWFGGLGDGSTTNRSTPTRVIGAMTFTEITAGWGHTCGRAVGGSVYCWGEGMAGALGLGTDVLNQLTPKHVLGNP